MFVIVVVKISNNSFIINVNIFLYLIFFISLLSLSSRSRELSALRIREFMSQSMSVTSNSFGASIDDYHVVDASSNIIINDDVHESSKLKVDNEEVTATAANTLTESVKHNEMQSKSCCTPVMQV